MDIHIRYLKTVTQSIYKGPVSQTDEVSSYKARKKKNLLQKIIKPFSDQWKKKGL